MRPIALRLLLMILCLSVATVSGSSSDVWFQKRVTWQTGKEPRVWETQINSPNGKESYRLALVPLWAMEGGIVGMEILVADPKKPSVNLLGVRQTDVPQPFVITVEELEGGIDQSQFGAARRLNVGHAELRIDIKGSRLGKGVGECGDCKNIQEIVLELTLRSR